MTNCTDTTCPVHFRNDKTEDSGDLYTRIEYIGEYAIYTDMSVTLANLLALGMELNLPITHDVAVYQVGHGSLSDVADEETGKTEDGVIKYSNTVVSAEEAKKLHNELAVMINAGTFNGANL